MKFNNQNIYQSLDDPKINEDISKSELLSIQASEQALQIDIMDASSVRKILYRFDEALVILHDISTFATLIQVVDSSNELAERLNSKCSAEITQVEQRRVPLIDSLMALSDEEFDVLIKQAAIKPFQFILEHERKMAIHRLSTDEETLLKQMSVDGLHAWGEQYTKLSATIQCEIDGKQVGLASAFNMTKAENRSARERAYRAIQYGWNTHQESVLAGLNAINGWRLNEFKRRSNKSPLDYLDVTCHQAHISRKTLDTLMNSAYRNIHIGRRAISAMDKWNGIHDAKPWDLSAPATNKGEAKSPNLNFDEAMRVIYDAFAEFDQEMADFSMMMVDKGWIDSSPTTNRSTGAFCTQFHQAGEPRIFMTYEGKDLFTLAHEIGHAWHAWVLRDLSYSEKQYPMTLAETASIFAETLVRQSLLRKATNDTQKREILWREAKSASVLLINIPSRYEFEKDFIEARKDAKVSLNSAKRMMHDAWEKWYGNTLSEYDDMFWASKLHFSIAEFGFYNYPYLFGYLFALGVYAQKDQQGDNFRLSYRELLKDTGRMSAEACIQKHLDRNIENMDFWQESLNIVDASISEFETLV